MMASEPPLVDELWESLVAVVIAAAVGLWWLARRPWLLGAAALAILVVATGGWLPGALVFGLILLALAGVRLVRPELFARLVSGPWHRAQTGGRYRRQWGEVAELCGLAKVHDGLTLRPDLLRVQVGSV